MADAVAQERPLVGGGEHDWSHLFGEWNIPARTTTGPGMRSRSRCPSSLDDSSYRNVSDIRLVNHFSMSSKFSLFASSDSVTPFPVGTIVRVAGS